MSKLYLSKFTLTKKFISLGFRLAINQKKQIKLI